MLLFADLCKILSGRRLRRKFIYGIIHPDSTCKKFFKCGKHWQVDQVSGVMPSY